MNINKQNSESSTTEALTESIARIKSKKKALDQKRTLLKINQISQSTDIESQDEIAKAIKQLDELATKL